MLKLTDWPTVFTIDNDMQRLIGVFASEIGLIWLLHRAAPLFAVDLAEPGTWTRFTPPDQIVMAAIRYVALGLAYWLLLSTIAYTGGLIARLPALVRSIEWATLPIVRTTARRAVALSLATTTMAPAVAFTTPAVSVRHHTVVEDAEQEDRDPDNIVVGISDGDTFVPPGATLPRNIPALPSVATPQLSASTTNPAAPSLVTARPTVTSQKSRVDYSVDDVYTVEPGDNLWNIAARFLEAVHPDDPLTQHQIAPYWARVVDLNLPSLRSKNPDWIYPGEVIHLPPIDEQ